MENMHLIPAWGHVADADLAAPAGYRIVGRVERDHYGAHLGMNVAEDERNAGLVELHGLSAAALVESEIEAFAVEQRKDIVKKRIPVGKLDLPARRDHQQRRLETFVLLHQLGNWRRLLRRRGRRGGPKRGEPDHNFRSVTHVASVSCELHLPL